MGRYFGVVDYKVLEAEYFLNLMKQVGRRLEVHNVQFCASAFVSSARSVTFAMQASIKEIDGFDTWYKEQQARLRSNPLAKFFHDFRTLTQHIGDTVIRGGRSSKEGVIYYFGPCADLKSVPELDVITACKEYFILILRLVYDCYIYFGPIIDGQQRYTESYFNSLGKTIEDAEEELGFRRGWTDIGDPSALPWRWEALRREADGCQIEEQFDMWLNLELPREPRISSYDSSQINIWFES